MYKKNFQFQLCEKASLPYLGHLYFLTAAAAQADSHTSFLLLNDLQDTVTSLILVRLSSRLFISYLCFDIKVIIRPAKEYFRTMFPFFGVLKFKQIHISSIKNYARCFYSILS